MLERHGGIGRSTPLVLLHQTASSSLGYLPLIEALGDSYHVLAVDTPGFGASDPIVGEVTVPRVGSLIVEALQHVGVSECWLYGHHTGAAIAASIAATHPDFVVKLMLSGPPLLSTEQKRRIVDTAVSPAIEEDGSHLIRLWRRHRRLASDVPLEVAQRELYLSLASAEPEKTYQAVVGFDFEEVLGQIGCPTYVMGGANDTIRSGLEPTAEGLAESELEVVPDAGIYLADQVPGLVADRIRAFFV
jgi:haloalkane dehalogenase